MAAILVIVGATTLLTTAGTFGVGVLLQTEVAVIAVALALLAISARAFQRDRLLQD